MSETILTQDWLEGWRCRKLQQLHSTTEVSMSRQKDSTHAKSTTVLLKRLIFQSSLEATTIPFESMENVVVDISNGYNSRFDKSPNGSARCQRTLHRQGKDLRRQDNSFPIHRIKVISNQRAARLEQRPILLQIA